MSWHLPFLFVLAAVSDWVTVLWHKSRERRALPALAIYSMLLEGLTWIPVIFAVVLEDWRVAIACILGSAVGTVWGVHKS